MIATIVNKLKSVFGKGLVDSVNDAGAIQTIKISGLENEVLDGIDRIQNYGMISNPPKGSEVVAVFMGGSREDGIAVAVDCGEYRITGLQTGEVCVYSKHGNTILFNTAGQLVLNSGAESAVKGDTMKGDAATPASYDGHKHGTAFGPSTVPTAPLSPTALNTTVKL